MATYGCQDCGNTEVRVHLSGIPLCDRCADKRIARLTGHPELPEPPPPLTLVDSAGQRHVLRHRIWRAPTGIEVELEEQGTPPGEGYHRAVLGDHDADVDQLVEHLRRLAEKDMARRFLEPNRHREGWLLKGDVAEGRLVWNEDDPKGVGTPYCVVIDGRTLTWHELGQALEGSEGWRLRIQLVDRVDDLRSEADALMFNSDPYKETSVERTAPSIDQLLNNFLADQRQRLADRTYSNYESVVDLLRHCLNGYGYQHLEPADQDRFDAAYQTDEEAFVHLFGPRELVAGIPEFLDYFMVRKVMAGEEILRAAGAVTTKLAKWLGEQGYLDATAVADTVGRGTEAARELPRAERLSGLLHKLARSSTVDVDAIGDADYIEDYLFIDRVEPRALWFEGNIGPLEVPKAVSDLAQVGWSVNVVLARAQGRWQLVEVGNVYP